MTGHSILDNLNAASKAGVKSEPSARFRTKDISVFNIYRNELNKFSLDGIESLAQEIELVGTLLHNLVVVYDPNEDGVEYRLVSGERRWLALRKLVNEGAPEYTVATCRIIPAGTPAQERAALILANSQREKTLADRLYEYEGLKESLEEMRAAGADFFGRDLRKGKMRDHMAAILQEATGTLANLEKISSNLQPRLRQLMETGQITFTAATLAADLTPAEQDALAGAAEEQGEPLTQKAVKRQKEATAREKLRESYARRTCPEMADSCGCDNADNLASFYRDGATAGCAGCCSWCNRAAECEKCCQVVRDRLAAQQGAEIDAQSAQEETGGEFDTEQTAPAQGLTDGAQSVKEETPADKDVDAHPEHASSMCYSCANWENCTEKSDRVQMCDKYENPAERRQQPEAGPIVTSQARTDAELFQLIARDGVYALQITRTEENRLQSLLSSMWARWEQTGGWKG